MATNVEREILGREGTEQIVANTKALIDALAAISYNAQDLTEEQKAQARENIGAAHVPTVTSEDNGKFLRVVDGVPAWVTIPYVSEGSF